jgi:hypothetical protein
MCDTLKSRFWFSRSEIVADSPELSTHIGSASLNGWLMTEEEPGRGYCFHWWSVPTCSYPPLQLREEVDREGYLT